MKIMKTKIRYEGFDEKQKRWSITEYVDDEVLMLQSSSNQLSSCYISLNSLNFTFYLYEMHGKSHFTNSNTHLEGHKHTKAIIERVGQSITLHIHGKGSITLKQVQ